MLVNIDFLVEKPYNKKYRCDSAPSHICSNNILGATDFQENDCLMRSLFVNSVIAH